MLIKNKIFFLIIVILNLLIFNFNLKADEFNISAVEVLIDKDKDIVTGKGSVEVEDKQGRIIKADKVTYKRTEELLFAEGSVEFFDTDGNILKTDNATYDKLNEIVTTFEKSNLYLKDGYELKSNKLIYNITKKIIKSDLKSTFADIDGNIILVDMFQYQIEKNLFSSVGKVEISDVNKNKYFFKELHVDTKKREMVGSDVSVLLDQESFGVDKESDPRFVANDVLVTKKQANFTKGVFTICKKREGKCPPWSLQAKEIRHDKIKKTIYYDSATLKFYDIPIFYFPKFFHPDPTVKRQSGFLTPFFTDTTTVGAGFGLPYYWAISNEKDFTFTPKLYAKENILFLNEYRQAFRNGFLILDTSYTQGYKETNKKKTKGSRNHLFAELDLDLSEDKPYESKLSFKSQRVSNNTYFRVHDINTALVNSENTTLENKVSYNFANDDAYVDLSATVYEDLRKGANDRYEFLLPNITYGKTFFTKNLGMLDFKTNAFYNNYDTDKHTTFINNDITWAPGNYITKKGFVNTFKGMVKNTNYEAKNTSDYKTDGAVSELTSVLTFKSSLPMQKTENNFSKIFAPNFMIRFAPGHMRNLSGDDVFLNYANLYSMNKTSEIEKGLTAILGFDYKIKGKTVDNADIEKLSVSMGQVFNYEENKDMPTKSSLNQKMSDVVGEIDYNFSEIGSIGYKFSLDNNLNDLNYNEISTDLNFGKFAFNLDYLEQRNHVGNENYISAGVTLNFNEKNKLGFSTKKNFKTDSAEFYNISYQYEIDCLTAGLVYRREFYEDSDLEPNDSLMFVMKFIPFAGARAPLIKP